MNERCSSQENLCEGGLQMRHKHRLTEESRKQSASDLQSRLKTRKLLGVGELTRDNGDIYRSKISQLLGINESLYVRFPKGLLIWNSGTALYFYIIGFVCLFFPVLGLKLDFGVQLTSPDSVFVGRIYGALLLSFGLLFRSILLQRENRSEIATLLLSVGVLHAAQLTVALFSGHAGVIHILLRFAAVAGSLTYHTYLDGQGGIFRQVMRYAEECALLAGTPPASDRSEKHDEKDKSL